MNKTAFIFPGQGSQYVGMGKDIYQQFKIARDLYDKAEELLGIKLKRLSFDGPEEKLRQTRYTQPAVFVNSMALLGILKDKGFRPSFTAGHSLGEYSALVCSGALNFSEAIKLVKLRAELMQETQSKRPGKMAAIIGLSEGQVAEVCKEASSEGVVVPANFNSPQQIIVSGETQPVKRAMKMAKAKGAKRAVQLRVNGAFHSPLMFEIKEKFTEELSELPMEKAKIPLISNFEADIVTEPEQFKRALAEQLTNPVKWRQSMEKMVRLGVNQMIEVGPGNVLNGLMRRINKAVKVVNAEKFLSQLEKTK